MAMSSPQKPSTHTCACLFFPLWCGLSIDFQCFYSELMIFYIFCWPLKPNPFLIVFIYFNISLKNKYSVIIWHTFMLFSFCMTNTKEDILKKVFVHTMKASGVEKAFVFCATQKKEVIQVWNDMKLTNWWLNYSFFGKRSLFACLFSWFSCWVH